MRLLVAVGMARQKEYPNDHSTLGVSASVSAYSAGTIAKTTTIVAINRIANLTVASWNRAEVPRSGGNQAPLRSFKRDRAVLALQ
jgi:hypothetical protein